MIGTHENAQDWEEGRRLQFLGSEPFNCSLHVVWTVFGLCWDFPWRSVPRSDVDAAEENGVKLYFDVVLF